MFSSVSLAGGNTGGACVRMRTRVPGLRERVSDIDIVNGHRVGGGRFVLSPAAPCQAEVRLADVLSCAARVKEKRLSAAAFLFKRLLERDTI